MRYIVPIILAVMWLTWSIGRAWQGDDGGLTDMHLAKGLSYLYDLRFAAAAGTPVPQSVAASPCDHSCDSEDAEDAGCGSCTQPVGTD